MKIVVRATDSNIIELLKNNFIEDGCYTKEIMAGEFIRSMETRPDDICVLIGYDDDLISGFLIGYVVDNRDYAYIAEAYSIADSDFAKEGIEKFVQWCKEKGKNIIRLETERNSVQMILSKRYDFNEHGVIMQRFI